jgi:hypothetical protein
LASSACCAYVTASPETPRVMPRYVSSDSQRQKRQLAPLINLSAWNFGWSVHGKLPRSRGTAVMQDWRNAEAEAGRLTDEDLEECQKRAEDMRWIYRE